MSVKTFEEVINEIMFWFRSPGEGVGRRFAACLHTYLEACTYLAHTDDAALLKPFFLCVRKHLKWRKLKLHSGRLRDWKKMLFLYFIVLLMEIDYPS